MAVSKDLQEVYNDNPSESINDDDIIYLYKNPYSDQSDSAILGKDLKKSLVGTYISENILLNGSPDQIFDLFTIPSGNFDFFIPELISIITVAATATSNPAPVVSIGYQDPDYNDYLDNDTLSDNQQNLAGSTIRYFESINGFSVSTSVDMKLKLITPGIGSVWTAKVIMRGWGVNLA